MVLSAYGGTLSKTPTETSMTDVPVRCCREGLNRAQSQALHCAACARQEEKRIPYSKQERLPPWQWKDVRWAMGTYITLTQLLGLWGVTYVTSCKAATLWCRPHRKQRTSERPAR